MILIKNAHILSMAGFDFENGCVLINDEGKIEKVAETIDCECAQVIDASGGWLCPGFVDAHCHIGLFNDGMGSEGSDGNEATANITPQMRAIDSINMRDVNFREAMEAGVTTLCTGPGSANVIGGQFVLMKNKGAQRIEDAIIKEPFALKIAFGENPKRVYGSRKQEPSTRMGTAAVLRQALEDGKRYKAKVERANGDPEKMPDYSLKLEAIKGVLDGKYPLKAHAHRADDILTAIRIANEFGLDYTLDHCTEGYLIADILKEENAKVIIGPLFTERSKVELNQLTNKAAKILYDAGVKFALMTDSPVIPEQYLPVTAAVLVKDGLPEMEALKAITINAAEILGVGDRVGSIEPGKDADIAIFNAHPLDFRAVAQYVLVDGKIVHQK